MGQFDQFANQGGPAAESADAIAESRRKTDEQLRTADYSGDLPEPLRSDDGDADESPHADEAAAAPGSDSGAHSGADDGR